SFHDPATSYIYPLSLHDALPIFSCHPNQRRSLCRPLVLVPMRSPRPALSLPRPSQSSRQAHRRSVSSIRPPRLGKRESPYSSLRSEEHTSELQSRSDLVCRLLLE